MGCVNKRNVTRMMSDDISRSFVYVTNWIEFAVNVNEVTIKCDSHTVVSNFVA